MRQLTDMVVAITGASAGIGRALAIELAQRGVRLALAARRTDKLQTLNEQLGGGHLLVTCDVADPTACAQFIQQTHAHYGRLDTLVCNAGYGLMRSIAEMTQSEWQSLMATNLYGTTNCIHAAIPVMQAQQERDHWRGQIMIVSSCLARRSGPEAGAYSATKAAQLAVAEALRIEMTSHKIAVTSVHPIGTMSEFFEQAEKRSGRATQRSTNEPTQTPQDVAVRMVRAIEWPCPEVWPYRMARWLFGALTLFPSLGDRLVRRRYGKGML